MMVVTNHMLRKKIAEVTSNANRYAGITTGAVGVGGDVTGGAGLSVQTITKVQNEYVITEEGTKAELFMPMPCLYWKCTGVPDKEGVITLQKQLRGLFLSDGENDYCIGVTGASDEFEVRFHVGSNELRLNNEFLNIVSKHYVRNGKEIP